MTAPDGRWFKDARLGMFVHWGPYAHAAGTWKGTRYHGIGEWLMHRAKIAPADYEAMARTFNPRKFSAADWVSLAADIGMKYIVITAKHHDGFAMFKSAASPYNIVDATPFKRDPLAELAEACRKRGIRLGFYYSQYQDWHAPGGGGNSTDAAVAGGFEAYFNRKALPQVEELMRNYGDVALIWFDTPGPLTRDDSLRLVETIRRLQPQCLINSRIGNGVGDYDTLGDQEIPLEARGGLWESIDTHNDTWGFVAHDHNWKDSRELVRRIVAVAARGGNYMLNVGPTGLGQIPAESARILREVGAWVHRHAESLYGAGPSPLGPLPWGECTVRESKLYLHVTDWPASGSLRVPGLKNAVRSVSLLGRKGSRLKAVRKPGGVAVALPSPSRQPATVVLEVAGAVRCDKTPVVLPGHRTDFNPPFAAVSGCKAVKFSWMEKFGDWKHADCVAEWTGTDNSAAWTFRTPEAGRYYLELLYSSRIESDGSEGMVTIGGTEVPFPVLDTGERSQTAELHGGWMWPLFRVYRCGIVHLPRAGKYTLSVRPTRETPGGWIKLKTVSLLPVPSC